VGAHWSELNVVGVASRPRADRRSHVCLNFLPPKSARFVNPKVIDYTVKVVLIICRYPLSDQYIDRRKQ